MSLAEDWHAMKRDDEIRGKLVDVFTKDIADLEKLTGQSFDSWKK